MYFFSAKAFLILVIIIVKIVYLGFLASYILRDGGSGYKTYVFKESIRRCAIDCKGRGRKEVIYLRVANVSYTRGVRESMGLLL